MPLKWPPLIKGANVTYLGGGSQIGHKESIKDTARVLGRMYDGIQYRLWPKNSRNAGKNMLMYRFGMD